MTFEENWNQQVQGAADHVKKIRVLLMREEKLQQLAAMSEAQVRFQSESQHHKMRFQHLQLLAELQQEELSRRGSSRSSSSSSQRQSPQHPEEVPAEQAYVGRLRLCVPVVRERAA
eukprot:COSAG04_NODE_3241_length_3013_cov_3.020933_2_plen_116_part_00